MYMRITNAVLAEKIDHLAKMMQEHVAEDRNNFAALHLMLHGEEGKSSGLRGRVQTLEIMDSARRRHFTYIWSVIVVLIGALVSKAFGWIG